MATTTSLPPSVRPPVAMTTAAVVVLLLATAPMGSDGFFPSTSLVPPRTSLPSSGGDNEGQGEMSPNGPLDRDAALDYKSQQPYNQATGDVVGARRTYNNGLNDNSDIGHNPGGGGSAVPLGCSSSAPPPPEQTPYGFSQWNNRGVVPLVGERPPTRPICMGERYNDGGTYEMEEWQPKQWWRGSVVEYGRPAIQQAPPRAQPRSTSPPAPSLPRSTSPRPSSTSTPRTSSPRTSSPSSSHPPSTTTGKMSNATSATSTSTSSAKTSRTSPPAPFFLTNVAGGVATDELTHLCDITLVSNDEVEHPAHRMMLAVRSSVLRELFRWKKTTPTEKLQVDASSEAVAQLLNYIYTDDIDDLSAETDDDNNDDEVLEEVFNLGVKYELPRLMILAEEQMVNTVSIENAATRLLMAMRHDSPYKGHYVKVVKDNLAEVMQTDGWTDVAKDPATMSALL